MPPGLQCKRGQYFCYSHCPRFISNLKMYFKVNYTKKKKNSEIKKTIKKTPNPVKTTGNILQWHEPFLTCYCFFMVYIVVDGQKC